MHEVGTAALALLTRGLVAQATARRLGISVHTVLKHRKHIYRKLDSHDRLTTVLLAQELGLLPAGTEQAAGDGAVRQCRLAERAAAGRTRRSTFSAAARVSTLDRAGKHLAPGREERGAGAGAEDPNRRQAGENPLRGVAGAVDGER
ncbi:response regulator transcription factor [Streptomyces sp. NPDC057694]|uniref:response regulator transcription factor n=1 Tax=Streptomyces sp. NPDC057694 TaxID=3346216 RepID=UPI00367D85C7